jgi:hypothetical protein
MMPNHTSTDEQTKGSEAEAEESIEEFKRLAGKGNSRGWRFDREEIHNRAETA